MLLERLGAGATTEVYRARDSLLEREVALKLLRVEHAADPARVRLFREEARSAASLSHPSIVQVYELGAAQEEEPPFVAMEYVGGGRLEDRLRGSGAMDPVEAARVAARISSALRAAHARGVVHGGLEPRNVLMTESGAVKVTGFGVARSDDGKDPGEDLRALGALLYEMLTGTPPGRAEETPRDLAPRIPETLSTLTMRLLGGPVEDGPADAATVAEELEAETEAARPRPESGPSRIYRAGFRLLPMLAERTRVSPPNASRKQPQDRPSTGAGGGRRRRRRRGGALAAVSVAILLAAAGWGLYDGGGLQSLYAEGLRQSGAPGSAAPPGPDAAPDRRLVHTAQTENISDNSTYLDLSQTNGRPDAFISITQIWNPGDGTGTYNEHPVGVWYDADRERWAVFNQDRAAMPEGASFNIVVWSGPTRAG